MIIIDLLNETIIEIEVETTQVENTVYDMEECD